MWKAVKSFTKIDRYRSDDVALVEFRSPGGPQGNHEIYDMQT